MRRVDEAVRTVLAEAIASDLKDPRIGFTTVTAVKTSPDLRQARVYVSVLEGGSASPETRATLDGLQSAHGYLQRRVAGELRLKHTPTLEFVYDEVVEQSSRIMALLAREDSEGAPRIPSEAHPPIPTDPDLEERS